MPKAFLTSLPVSLSRENGRRCAFANSALVSGASEEMPNTSAPASLKTAGQGSACQLAVLQLRAEHQDLLLHEM